jgi:hypothetical protein
MFERGIVTAVAHREDLGDGPLYQRILGASWSSLPESLRAMHSAKCSRVATGRAEVRRGTGLLARAIASAMGFPLEGVDIPVEVRFDVREGRETWTRCFAGRAFSSLQFEGAGRFGGLLCERFGPLTFGLALVVDEGYLRLMVRGWSFLGIPLPRAFAPRSASHEHEENGQFHFDVQISHPLTGLIVHYRGWLMAAS